MVSWLTSVSQCPNVLHSDFVRQDAMGRMARTSLCILWRQVRRGSALAIPLTECYGATMTSPARHAERLIAFFEELPISQREA